MRQCRWDWPIIEMETIGERAYSEMGCSTAKHLNSYTLQIVQKHFCNVLLIHQPFCDKLSPNSSHRSTSMHIEKNTLLHATHNLHIHPAQFTISIALWKKTVRKHAANNNETTSCGCRLPSDAFEKKKTDAFAQRLGQDNFGPHCICYCPYPTTPACTHTRKIHDVWSAIQIDIHVQHILCPTKADVRRSQSSNKLCVRQTPWSTKPQSAENKPCARQSLRSTSGSKPCVRQNLCSIKPKPTFRKRI